MKRSVLVANDRRKDVESVLNGAFCRYSGRRFNMYTMLYIYESNVLEAIKIRLRLNRLKKG